MQINKILLLVPSAITPKAYRDINPLPPLGLGYLAAIMENMGIEVRILDCLMHGWQHQEKVSEDFIRVGLPEEAIEDYILSFNPDLVGVSCQFSRQHQSYHRLFSLIKKVKPECIVLAGGAHVSVCPQEVLEDKNCDFILIGEAEESLKELLSSIIEGKEFSLVDGLGWKVDGKLHINNKTKWIANLDTLPLPSHSLMNLDSYFGLKSSHGLRHKNRFSPIITSRGCPVKCTFCSAHKAWGNNYRFRSIDNILEEMRILRFEYGIEELLFEDDNVTANTQRAKELFSRMAKEELGFVWDTPNGVGVWSIDEEMIDAMKKSGCVRLNFPVESGSQYVVDNIIKKPIKLAKVKQLIRHCNKIGLDYGMFLVIGMPGEKIEDIWSSFRFAAECGCYQPHISVATPYPGTELFADCLQNSLFAREFKLEDLFIRSFMIRTDDWDEEDLKKILVKGDIYLKFREARGKPALFMKKLISKIKSPISILHYLRKMVRYLFND